MVWLTGGGLALALLMITGLLALVIYQGIITFLPRPLVQVTLHDGRVHLGEVTRRERFSPAKTVIDQLPEPVRAAAAKTVAANGGKTWRRLIRTGNYEISGEHFNWVTDYEVANETLPPWALEVERLTWGRFYGEPAAFEIDHPLDTTTLTAAKAAAAGLPADSARVLMARVSGKTLSFDEVPADAVVTAYVECWKAPAAVWDKYQQYHGQVRERWMKRRRLEKQDTGRISLRAEAARLKLREVELAAEKAELRYGADAAQAEKARRRLAAERKVQAEVEATTQQAFLQVRGEINMLNRENDRYRMVMRTASGQETTLALDEVARAYPANQIGLWQTAGIYLSRWGEFLTEDPREANTEGGVFPAIFGTVVMTLLMSLLVVPFGVLAALYLREYAKAGPMISAVRIAINNLAGVPSIVFGVFGLGFFCYLVGGTIDSLFFEAKLPSPTYGTGGIMWAAFTLALLTLPVVIVATEEALSAVPGSMREGSYACGASKWQTIKRIVLPRAMPGIMTGMILAMARGAGEVAPLMLVGAVKLAPELPVDGVAPFIHPERSFMHLGFHIFDLGFQSQNSEAAKPMVFTTTLLLIAIVAGLNITAVLIRNRLRRRFATSAF